MGLAKWVVTGMGALSIALLVTSCQKPKAGGKCKTDNEVKCVDKKNALVCVSGTWEAKPCKGLNGCLINSCTNKGEEMGWPCPENGKWECSPDKKTLMECQNNHWAKKDDCRGQNGCVVNAMGYKCDKGTAEAGDACTKDNEGNASCSPDKKDLLVCKDGKMTVESHCKGMHGCRQMGTKIECDDSIAEVDDPCTDNSGSACAPDKKAMLTCKDGKMKVKKKCRQCTVFLEKIQCQ